MFELITTSRGICYGKKHDQGIIIVSHRKMGNEMSEYYKRIKNDAKKYGYLNLEKRLYFYTARFLTILCIIGLIGLPPTFPAHPIQDDSLIGSSPLILMIIGTVSHFVSIMTLKKHTQEKMDAVKKFLKNSGLSLIVIKEIIAEIENYTKNTKTFAVWVTGLFVTYVALLSTLVGNLLSKILDALMIVLSEYIAHMPEDDFLNLIYSSETAISNNMNPFSFILEIFFFVLLFFIAITIMVYLAFSIFSFSKKQVLLFLYDLRYELLSDENTTI